MAWFWSLWYKSVNLQILALLDVRYCWKLSLYAISRKTNKQNLRKRQKKNLVQILADFGTNLIRKIFLWVLPKLDISHCCKVSLYAISKKINELNVRKWQKKPSFCLDLNIIVPNLDPKNFFRGFFTSIRC